MEWLLFNMFFLSRAKTTDNTNDYLIIIISKSQTNDYYP